MLSRMNNRFVSQPFQAHLRSLKGKITYVQSMQPSLENKTGRNHDETFLLSVIPHLQAFIKAEIPNLQAMAIATAADKVNDKAFKIKIYNKDTCAEYYDLLCELLDHFHTSLEALKQLQRSAVANGVVEQDQQKKNTAQPSLIEIISHLRLVLLMGQSLREMV